MTILCLLDCTERVSLSSPLGEASSSQQLQDKDMKLGLMLSHIYFFVLVQSEMREVMLIPKTFMSSTLPTLVLPRGKLNDLERRFHPTKATGHLHHNDKRRA